MFSKNVNGRPFLDRGTLVPLATNVVVVVVVVIRFSKY